MSRCVKLMCFYMFSFGVTMNFVHAAERAEFMRMMEAIKRKEAERKKASSVRGFNSKETDVVNAFASLQQGRRGQSSQREALFCARRDRNLAITLYVFHGLKTQEEAAEYRRQLGKLEENEETLSSEEYEKKVKALHQAFFR